jgi:hypothetical protein
MCNTSFSDTHTLSLSHICESHARPFLQSHSINVSYIYLWYWDRAGHFVLKHHGLHKNLTRRLTSYWELCLDCSCADAFQTCCSWDKQLNISCPAMIITQMWCSNRMCWKHLEIPKFQHLPVLSINPHLVLQIIFGQRLRHSGSLTLSMICFLDSIHFLTPYQT